MLKPLSELMDQASVFMGQTKTAAPAYSDEVSSLADTLAFAKEIEQNFGEPAERPVADADFEKVAKEINIMAAQAELEVWGQAEQFREEALAKGYTNDQVSEALSKIAAQKIKKNLPELAALGFLTPGGENVNSLEKTHVKATPEEKKRLPVTHSLGGAR